MKTYKNTSAITLAYLKLLALETNLGKVLNQSFFQRKVSMKEKIEYISQIAKAHFEYWHTVKAEYPELATDGLAISGNSTQLTVKNPELLTP